MIYVTVQQQKDVAKILGDLGKKAPGIIARALNRSAESARTNVVRQAREAYFVKSADVRGTITIQKATTDRLWVIVKSRGTRRPLSAFNVKPGRPIPKKPPAVLRVAVMRSGLKGLPGAFLARGRASGKLHVLTRVSSKRYPIRIRYGPSVPEMIGSNLSKGVYRSHVERQAEEIFVKRLDHEINRVLGG